MKEKMNQIKDGVMEHEELKTTPLDFLVYEKMTEKELLAEYKKETDFIKELRESFAETLKIEKERGSDDGISYIGDDKKIMERIKKLQEIMDEQGIPYEHFE